MWFTREMPKHIKIKSKGMMTSLSWKCIHFILDHSDFTENIIR